MEEPKLGPAILTMRYPRRAHRQTARASLGWFLVAFGSIHLALSALVGWGPAEFHDPLYGEKLDQLRRRTARAPAGTPLLLVLGSSRALTGLNARLFEQRSADQGHPIVAYNFAVPGGGPVSELLLFRRLLNAGILPNTLVLEVWPPFFADCAIRENLAWLESHGIGIAERRWLASYGPPGDPRLATTTSGVLVPWYRYRFALLHRTARGFMPGMPWGVLSPWFDDAGWEPIADTYRTAMGYAQFVSQERQALAPYFQNHAPAPASCRILRDLVDLATQKGIRVVLTMFPEASDLRHWCSDKNRCQIMAEIDQLCRRYDIELVDGHEWLSDDDFLDPVHPIASGADRFTRRLAASVIGRPVSSPRRVVLERALRR